MGAYLRAVEKAGTDDADAVFSALQEIDLNDMFVKNGTLYPNGRLAHDMHLLEVKAPAELTEGDDYFQLVSTVAAADAFRDISASTCPLIKK